LERHDEGLLPKEIKAKLGIGSSHTLYKHINGLLRSRTIEKYKCVDGKYKGKYKLFTRLHAKKYAMIEVWGLLAQKLVAQAQQEGILPMDITPQEFCRKNTIVFYPELKEGENFTVKWYFYPIKET